MDYTSVSIFLKCSLGKTLNSHGQIVSEADPVVEDYFGPFVWLEDEVDDDVALVRLEDQEIGIDDVTCLGQHVFEAETILKVAVAIVGSRSGEGVALESESKGVLNDIG